MDGIQDRILTVQPPEFQNLLTTSEVANMLRCSEKTILRRVQAGALPTIKEGGRYLFDAQVIRAALITRMVRPKSKASITFRADACHCNRSIQTDQELE